MESDAHRWDEKYRASTIDALRAEPLLSRHIARIRHLSGSRTALELAAGRCHVSVYLATEGLSVTALDCSAVGLDLGQALAAQEGVQIKTSVADLETDPLPVGPWSLIACFRYLNRELFEPMKAGLEPGGLLFFSTFNRHHLENAPRFNPSYVLAPGELEETFGSLEILELSDGHDPSESASWVLARR